MPFDGKYFIPEISTPLKAGNLSVSGRELIEKAKEDEACFGQRHAEWLLEHQNIIPVECRAYYLVFPGTMWEDITEECLWAPCLEWYDCCWHLIFERLAGEWRNNGRLVRVRRN